MKAQVFKGRSQHAPVEISHSANRARRNHIAALDRTVKHDAIRVIMGPNAGRIAKMLVDAERSKYV